MVTALLPPRGNQSLRSGPSGISRATRSCGRGGLPAGLPPCWPPSLPSWPNGDLGLALISANQHRLRFHLPHPVWNQRGQQSAQPGLPAGQAGEGRASAEGPQPLGNARPGECSQPAPLWTSTQANPRDWLCLSNLLPELWPQASPDPIPGDNPASVPSHG